MKKNLRAIKSIEPAGRALFMAMSAAGILSGAGSAHAVQINVDNPDVEIRFDNTIRLNTGVRTSGRDAGIGNNPAHDEDEYLFDRGDIINKRIDLLTEVDVSYAKKFGARVSAAAWFDAAYGSTGKSNPALASIPSYPNNQFTPLVNRYYRGPSGEFLDAFVWGNLPIGETNLNVKLGRHVSIWGEGLFGNKNAISYSQAPSDDRKAVSSPGASAKETALPTNQLTATWQLNPEVSVSGLYSLEWRPSRLPEGGTYFGATDVILEGSPFISTQAPFVIGRAAPIEGSKGDIGLNLVWRPSWLGGAAGVYYRKFDEKNAWVAQLSPTTTPGWLVQGQSVYAKDVELLGFSLTKLVGPLSVAGEVSYRKNMPLNMDTGFAFGAGPRLEGPKGNTFHALINGLMLFNKSPFWDTASLAAELAYQRLGRVTANPDLYFSADNPKMAACQSNAIVQGCSTRSASTVGVSFIPTWIQVFPSVDLSAPMFVQYNIKGNAATNQGNMAEGGAIVRLGLTAEIKSVHKLELAYTAFSGKSQSGLPGNVNIAGPYNALNGITSIYSDRNYVSLTYSTSF